MCDKLGTKCDRVGNLEALFVTKWGESVTDWGKKPASFKRLVCLFIVNHKI